MLHLLLIQKHAKLPSYHISLAFTVAIISLIPLRICHVK